MRQAFHHLCIRTGDKRLKDITREVNAWIAREEFSAGLLTLYIRHTSASLLIQENADPDVRADLEAFFERLAPESGLYIHDAEGPDDMPAHIRAALTQTHLSIPLENGKLALGEWQGVYVFEHRRTERARDVALHFIGD
jgi:secondary thiamine-phosphate synthase enzyme